MGPALPIVVFNEDSAEFLKRLFSILIFSVKDEIIVLCQQRNQTLSGVPQRPG